MKYYLTFLNITSNLKIKSLLIHFRNFSEVSESVKRQPFNPFKKKVKNWFINKDDDPVAKRICVTIFGNGAYGQPRCLALFTNTKGFLFNCGEGVGRLCKEYEVSHYSIQNVFITYKNWRNLSGLPDFVLSNEMHGVSKIYIQGPPGVEYFLSIISASLTQVGLRKRKDKYTDENIEILSIPLENNSGSLPLNFKSHHMHIGNANPVFCYSCKIHGRVGEFLPEKCVELGVPIGPHLLKLKNGEDTTLPSGRIIRYDEVTDYSSPSSTFLVVDCPSEEYLDLLVANEELSQYQLPSDYASTVPVVFHFSPVHIASKRKYQNWMRKFHQNTEHYLLNSNNSSISSEVVYRTQAVLNLLHPQAFKHLPEEHKPSALSGFKNINVVQPPPMLQYYFRPKQKLDWCNVVKNNCQTNIENLVSGIPKFQELVKTDAFPTEINKQKTDYPEVIFLGTSSASSSPFRNVSAILLNTDDTRSILLDCGEGTLMQLVRYYGSSEANSILRKLSCIFITHKHTDHYMGIFEVIQARKEAFKHAGITYQPLCLILPRKIKEILHRYCELFANILPEVQIFLCKFLLSDHENYSSNCQYLKAYLGNVQIEMIPVIHCEDAYGAALHCGSDWKIVYSGDTAPCQSLVEMGKDCTLLIHESSIEDHLVNEAVMKKHCTPSQVIDIAQKMNAKYTIMTHFSKRYLAIPVIQTDKYSNIGFAFDFMKVSLKDLQSLPKILPTLQTLFQEQLNTHLQKTSHAASFENIFLKTYRSLRSQ